MSEKNLGKLMATYFIHEDYLLIRETMNNLYSDIVSNITITPDSFLSFVGSPYTTPINVELIQEYPHPITLLTIKAINALNENY